MSYDEFIKRVYQDIGINLQLYKEKQMKRRLTSLRDKRGYDNFYSYYAAITKDHKLLDEFIDRITINVTEFYRNPKRWDNLHKDILPEIVDGKTSLNIWSAACSTGEEPYTIAMVMKEHFPNINVNILATDIDENALGIAKQGVYKKSSFEDLPPYYIQNYFTKNNELYYIDPTLKRSITFKKHDLLQDTYPKKKDLIICRNVLIYFTDEAKDAIYKNFSHALKEEGVLFVGSTEQIFHPNKYNFYVLDTFFYQKRKEG
ncbi:MAG TPA: protein-glutamate O-methyltransferase CheR [Bacillota bacterium]|nr:protein-glutamate O-methyltransferase CheR [Bacillota bacterium]